MLASAPQIVTVRSEHVGRPCDLEDAEDLDSSSGSGGRDRQRDVRTARLRIKKPARTRTLSI